MNGWTFGPIVVSETAARRKKNVYSSLFVPFASVNRVFGWFVLCCCLRWSLVSFSSAWFFFGVNLKSWR